MSAGESDRRTSNMTGIVSLLLVYVVWGSTYLAIRVAVQDGAVELLRFGEAVEHLELALEREGAIEGLETVARSLLLDHHPDHLLVGHCVVVPRSPRRTRPVCRTSCRKSKRVL